MVVSLRVGFRVWLRNVTQVETSALVRCRGAIASSLTTTFLVACDVLRHGDAAELINNIPYLLFDPLWSEVMMQNTVLNEENCEQLFRLASNLASLSTDVHHLFKTAKTIQKLLCGFWNPLRKLF